MAPISQIIDEASAISYIEDHLPSLEIAIIDAVKNGNANYTVSTNTITSSQITTTPIERTKHPRSEANGFRRIMTTDELITSRPSIIHPRAEMAESRLRIAAPILIVLALLGLGVGMWVLWGKVRVCLRERRKDGVFRLLESQREERERGYGSFCARRGSRWGDGVRCWLGFGRW